MFSISEGERYLKTYWVIQKRKDLNQTEKDILQLVISFKVAGEECYINEENISQLFCVSRASITRAKKSLSEKGLITIGSKFVGGTKVSTITIQVDELNRLVGHEFIITEKPVHKQKLIIPANTESVLTRSGRKNLRLINN